MDFKLFQTIREEAKDKTFQPMGDKEKREIAKDKGVFMCPQCKQPLIEVDVYSTVKQLGILKGNRIVDITGSLEFNNFQEKIECPDCGTDLTNEVERFE